MKILRTDNQASKTYIRLMFVLMSFFVAIKDTAAVAQTQLKIQIEHQERLEDLRQKFPVGGIFELDQLELDRDNQWVKIPKSICGVWGHSYGRRLAKSYDWNSKTNSWEFNQAFHQIVDHDSGRIIGNQRDRAGDIWAYTGIPAYTKREKGELFRYQIKQKVDKADVTPSSIAFSHAYTTIWMNSASRSIVEVKQIESIQTYERFGRSLKCNFSVVNFDEEGNPMSKSVSQSFMNRLDNFSPQRNGYGRNLEADFIQFLEVSGQKDLIP
ncbi:MAG: hypothetical protein C0507_00545 [Cyanobacteria bacterium PR.3.49]|nr:hypothetical protein [Cyanobacteria bacterium PR.3.49]